MRELTSTKKKKKKRRQGMNGPTFLQNPRKRGKSHHHHNTPASKPVTCLLTPTSESNYVHSKAVDTDGESAHACIETMAHVGTVSRAPPNTLSIGSSIHPSGTSLFRYNHRKAAEMPFKKKSEFIDFTVSEIERNSKGICMNTL